MDSIDIIKPLSTVLSSAVNKSRQCRESNPEPLDAERERYPLCLCAPPPLRARSIFTSSAFRRNASEISFVTSLSRSTPVEIKRFGPYLEASIWKRDKTTRLNFFVPFWKYVARLCQPSFQRKWCGCKKMWSFDFFLFFEAVSSFLFSVEILRRKL